MAKLAVGPIKNLLQLNLQPADGKRDALLLDTIEIFPPLFLIASY